MPPTNRARGYTRGPHLFRRAGVYYARTKAHPKGVSLHTRDRGEAERRFRALLDGDAPGPVGGASGDALLVALARDFLASPHGYTRRTLEGLRGRLAAVGKWLDAHGVTRPADITDNILDAWITERSETVSRRTLNRDLRALRVCLRWAAGRGLTTFPPALARKGLREPRPSSRRVLPDPGELGRALEAVANAGHRDGLVLLVATGLRCEELVRLTAEDLHDGSVWVQPEPGPAAVAEPGKGYQSRRIPVVASVLELARRFLTWRTGKRGRSAHKNALHRSITKACSSVGVPKFGLHDLRRVFATEAVRGGIPITVVSGWLGHRLVSTTERYIGRYRSDTLLVAPLPPTIRTA